LSWLELPELLLMLLILALDFKQSFASLGVASILFHQLLCVMPD
jgi:hypothetical protein